MKFKKHIPNILSSLRLFSPLVLTPLIISGNYLLAFIALCSFLATDAFDGYLARKWQVQSELGAKIDAFADKLILASLLLPLLINNYWILINAVLEGFISFVNVKRKIEGGNPKTLQIGRMKMIILSIFMALSYLNSLVTVPKLILELFYVSTIVLQVKSLYAYFMEMKKENKEKLEKNKLSQNTKMENISSIESDNLKIKKKELNDDNITIEKLLNTKSELINLKNNVINMANSCKMVKDKRTGFCKIKKDNN